MKSAEVSFEIEGFINELSEPEEKKEGIVKTKRFPFRPMSPEEATMQMDFSATPSCVQERMRTAM
jgi:hypothetical protein